MGVTQYTVGSASIWHRFEVVPVEADFFNTDLQPELLA